MSNDVDDNGRDANGRWKKGHCPNPKGRPRKRLQASQADVYEFKETLVDAVINGKSAKVTRHEMLMLKMFEEALKGNVPMQRKLFDRFEQSDEVYQQGEMCLAELGKQMAEQYDKTGQFDEGLYSEYCRLYYLLRRREHHEVVNEAVQPPHSRS